MPSSICASEATLLNGALLFVAAVSEYENTLVQSPYCSFYAERSNQSLSAMNLDSCYLGASLKTASR